MPSPSSSALYERREALALVADEAARAREGTGRLVLLRGATGTGRTALLEAATEHAETHGMRVLRVRCSAEGSATGAHLPVIEQLLSPIQELQELAIQAPHPAARLWRSLHAYAAEGPVLVAVDDVHLADEDSRCWLIEAARRVDRLPVLLLVTERSQYDVDPPSAGLVHTLSPALVRTHTLAPLSRDAATELVRSAVGDAPKRWVADHVRASGGNPLLLRALLEDRNTTTGAPAALPETCAALYPGAYPAAVAWWLDCAGAATADAARVFAALDELPEGAEVDLFIETVTGMGELGASSGLGSSGSDPARVRGWLTAMTRLGLLRLDVDGRPRYAHPLLRDAVLAGWPAADRQAAHRAAAEAMLRRGDPTETVAGQLLRSGTVDEVWATDALLDAATGAVRDDRTDDAVVLLRRALTEPMSAGRRAEVLTELGSLEFAAVRSSAGIPRLTEAMRLPGQPRYRVQAAVALGTALARRGEARAAVTLLHNLDGQLTDHPDLLRTVQTASALLSDHDQTIREETYRRLRETAEHTPQALGPAGRALLVRYEATAGLTSSDAAMKRVRALLTEPAGPLAEPFLLGTAAAVAQWADELDEAERLTDRGLTGQRPTLLHPMHEALLNVRADIAAARGDYGQLLSEPESWRRDGTADGEGFGFGSGFGWEWAAGAGTGTEPWSEAGDERKPAAAAGPGTGNGSGNGPTNAEAHVLLALVETGRLDEAWRLADAFDLREAHDSWELNRFLYARGVVRAASGDPAGALGDFLECGRRQSAREVLSPVVTPWRAAAAQCRLALGHPREALVLAEEELRLARVWNTPRLIGRSLRVLGTATGGRHGLDLSDESVRVLRDASVETELIPALIARGRQLIAAGERTRARKSLREAAERAERLGAVRLRSAADEALREGGARRTATTLTASERRIAELAAEGRTNTEIAELLHVARRTVETHLTSAYRKLGIRRRGELAAALDRVPGAGPRTAR
ncbi:AAA family ATPase [Streptomyces turgidiscabies]|uniref:Transcriptional regulator, LuxR family n=1 Tax=Streptomyces turgidiscabies (strain Car8) TaxID=698760 RepID=L7FE60_STRT8|nr:MULTISPECIES: LuxR family transcriptional regulator [Streptomyces]ELP69494.1 transcriptional regulator, LuxR family [Streptomyces turgidiscabies Car8]MDX3494395.1 AAA family ATPase [Streptomyces turgidiscabies]GAQ74674.1 bacterial regulatory proteins, luxR family [Streptomyces turgidiscabies]